MTNQEERDTKTELWYILGDVNPEDPKIERLESYITAREAEVESTLREKLAKKVEVIDLDGEFEGDIYDGFDIARARAAREIRNSK